MIVQRHDMVSLHQCTTVMLDCVINFWHTHMPGGLASKHLDIYMYTEETTVRVTRKIDLPLMLKIVSWQVDICLLVNDS